MGKDINVVSVRWFDGYLEEFEATEVRFGSDLLFLRLADGKNRHIPLRHVRWFGMSKESHQLSDRTKKPNKEDLAKFSSGIFDVPTQALTLPDIDSHIGLMHTLFVLEDLYGLHAASDAGTAFLFVDDGANEEAAKLHSMLLEWGNQFKRLLTGRISRADYNQWRYNYPEKIKARRAKSVKVKRVALRGK